MKIALACSLEMKRQGGTSEDGLLARRLSQWCHQAELVAWDELGRDWADYDRILLRSCWDYHLRPQDFRGWLRRLSREGCQVRNPVPLVLWNMDKHYLLDLEKRGVPIVPTRYLAQGSRVRLEDLFSGFGRDQLVMKPAVGATAFGVWCATEGQASPGEDRLNRDLIQGSVLVQPFVDAIRSEGEWSLILIDGKPSHAVLKRPCPGDFRVQSEWGGSYRRRPIPRGLSQAALAALAALPEPPLYARADMVRVKGRFQLMELELIEPHLFLTPEEPALDRLANGLLGWGGK